MNITSHTSNIPLPTVTNQATDSLQRENVKREVIAQPAAAQQSAAEKGVGSERERAKSSAQNNEQIDFESIRKQAEKALDEVNGSSDQSQQEKKQNPESDTNSEDQRAFNQATEDVDGKNKAETDEDRKAVEQSQQIAELKSRDQEVRTHEQAHASVGGSHAGAPSYTYEVGPDGNKYAVGGEVSIDVSPVSGDPQATISKMQKVYSAALAPAQPSSQDIKVAASASRTILEAQSQLLENTDNDVKAPLGNISKENLNENTLDEQEENSSSVSDFDHFMNETLKAQDAISASRSTDIDKRAGRIESFYSTINHAFEKAPNHQFELTA